MTDKKRIALRLDDRLGYIALAFLFVASGFVFFEALEASNSEQIAAQEVTMIRAETARMVTDWRIAMNPTCQKFRHVQGRGIVLCNETVSTLTKACRHIHLIEN